MTGFYLKYNTRLKSIKIHSANIESVMRVDVNSIRDGSFRGCSQMAATLKSVTHISYSDEIWHSYNLSKEDP